MHLNQYTAQLSQKVVSCSLSLSFPIADGQPPVTIPFSCQVDYTQAQPDMDITIPGPVVDVDICKNMMTDVRLAVIQVVESADDATVKLNNGTPISLIGASPPEPQFVPRGAGFAPGLVFYYNPTGGLNSIKFNSTLAGIKLKISIFGT